MFFLFLYKNQQVSIWIYEHLLPPCGQKRERLQRITGVKKDE